LAKKEAVLTELANGNYNVESIIQKTEAKPKRVVEIINNQVQGVGTSFNRKKRV